MEVVRTLRLANLEGLQEVIVYQGILLSDSNLLADLKAEHLETLSAPLDAYWEEALIGFSDHYELKIDGVRAGFYCLNADKQLVAFYLSQEYADHGEGALSHVISEQGVKAALAGTNDSYFLSLCLDIAVSSRVHTLLFMDHKKVVPELDGSDLLSFDVATDDDFADVFKHYCATSDSMDNDSIETGFENIKGYIRSMMDEHHIFVLREHGKLIATSECRISKTQKPYADLGVIVAAENRRKGVGSYILARTKEFCYERDAIPICSCEAGNMGSKKAIAKAGFVSRHRIVLTHFGE